MTWTTQAWGHSGKTYDAKDMRELVEAIFYGNGGVVHGLAVSQQGSPAATVQVAAGKAIVNASGSGLYGYYHAWNDATVNSPTIDPTTTNGRKDRLIVRVSSGVPALEVVKGTASGSPVEPSITGDNYLELALITLPGSTTNITDAMITDRRKYAAAVGGRVLASSADTITGRRTGDGRWDSDTSLASNWDGSAWIGTVADRVPHANLTAVAISGTRTLNSTTYAGVPTDTVAVSSFVKRRADTLLIARFSMSGIDAPTTACVVSWAVQVNGTDYLLTREAAWTGGLDRQTHTGSAKVTGLAAGTYTCTLRYKVDANSAQVGIFSEARLEVEEIFA